MLSPRSFLARAVCLPAFTLGAFACEPSEPRATGDATAPTQRDAAPAADDSPEPDTSCPSGQEYFVPGCGTEPNLLQAGCYQACEGENDDSCANGTVCTTADINPCICPDQDVCCDACGQAVWLCQVPPESEPCEELGESACAEDERCQVVRASLVDEAAQCRGPAQFAACAPRTGNECTGAITVARDAQDRCWWFTGDCGIPGFDYFITGDGDCRPVAECSADAGGAQ